MCTKDIALKAACADNFYYPKDYIDSLTLQKQPRGDLDSYQRKKGFEHHLGKNRVKLLDKGFLLIRFELPFDVQCLRCQKYIGQGTRYDADKKKIGMYFSTPIYEFLMRCKNPVGMEKSATGGAGSVYCDQRFCIRTDPKNADYELVEGIRRKVQTWTPGPADGTLELTGPEERRQIDSDPMVKAEHTIRNKERERSQKERLGDLLDLQDDREDAYALNCVLRKSNRERRKKEQAEAEAAAKRPPPNFGFPLLAADPGDAAEAKTVEFRTDHDRIATAAKRAAVRAAPLLKRSHSGNSLSAKAAKQLEELSAKRQKLSQHARMAQLFNKK